MLKTVSLLAPAKVNLHLAVLGLRPDGYHDIQSLFQTVSLCDELAFTLLPGDRGIEIDGDFPFPPESNIITSAIRAFGQAAAISMGVRVRVEKRIPVQAGLGGGSSDAAATLRCMGALFPGAFSRVNLTTLAESLGSDVPFFLAASAALVEGRGERVTPVRPRLDYAIVAVRPGVGVATRDAYQWHDEAPQSRTALAGAAVCAAYEGGAIRDWPFFNDFDRTVFARIPAAESARNALLAEGAVRAGLTGSGSTVIGVFADRDAAAAGARRLSDRGHAARFLLPLATIPTVCYYE